jgi:serine protease Do
MRHLKPRTTLLAVFAVLALVQASCDSDDPAASATPGDAARAGGAAGPQAPQIQDQDGLTVVEIAARLKPSIVRVQTETASLDIFGRVIPNEGVGTGVIIDGDGYIVTNNHVVTARGGQRPAQTITVTLSDQRTLPAEIVGRDQATDLAVIRIEEDGLTAAAFADPDGIQVGQEVVAIGFALGLEGEPTVTRGVISARNRTIQEQPYTIPDAIQTDAGINPGNSGGPLVNARGEIVGINTAIIQGAQNIGFSISVSLVEPIVTQLIESGEIERSYMGIGTVDVTESIAENFDLPVDEGIAVTVVQDGSPADEAGLRENDIIVEIGGEAIANNGELLALLATRQPGDDVVVRFYRDGEPDDVTLTLGGRPVE